jgi:hypothetical protein
VFGLVGKNGHKMKQEITGYHKDEEDHWVAQLVCGHFQHVRHDPPWVSRPWVTSLEGRDSMLGFELNCKKCDQGLRPDHDH